jgi:hypothetical protein
VKSVRKQIESPIFIRSLEFSPIKFYLERYMMRPIDVALLPAYRVARQENFRNFL